MDPFEPPIRVLPAMPATVIAERIGAAVFRSAHSADGLRSCGRGTCRPIRQSRLDQLGLGNFDV